MKYLGVLLFLISTSHCMIQAVWPKIRCKKKNVPIQIERTNEVSETWKLVTLPKLATFLDETFKNLKQSDPNETKNLALQLLVYVNSDLKRKTIDNPTKYADQKIYGSLKKEPYSMFSDMFVAKIINDFRGIYSNCILTADFTDKLKPEIDQLEKKILEAIKKSDERLELLAYKQQAIVLEQEKLKNPSHLKNSSPEKPNQAH